ncbi:probable methyltransferase-like protein 25 isoform X3 [Leptidea sinapis]|nr:probable methyltransferase-like protein 25 isoform X3 [Leptidea sinapis]XP_050663768.1 probable methyltransferase-like protein 25 isoform X3 [Leptidea sinapis]
MSPYIASLHRACNTSHCVEAGGGRGHLLVTMSLGHHIPSLTIDCDETTLNNAKKRVKLIQKQWHAIAKRANGGANVWTGGGVDTNLHRFACSYITRDTDLSSVVREQFDCEEVNLLLTGLHTCGDLGPSCLRLFTVSPAVRVLFNVPCCYHLLSEAVDVAMFDDDQTATDDKGFPMSQYLRGLNLGRNARMLGAQSIDRVRHYRQMPDRSLLYRALLQVTMKKFLPHTPIKEGKLKGFASKCQSFQQYFKMADEKLGLNIFNSLPECYLIELERTMDCQWKKIVLFYLMRLCLAQVIEGVILLDRLLYLYECGCKNAYLVKLFDPVLSPRCHSIVAIRN